MATITFACPDCQTNLKTSRRITPDREVRCPKCGTVFPAPPETDSDLLEPSEESMEGSAPPASSRDLGSPQTVAPGKRVRRIIWVSAGIVLAFTMATAYLVWSAIVNRGRNAGTGQENPLAYVPADSTVVVGINYDNWPDDPAWHELFEKFVRLFSPTPGFLDDCRKNTGVEFSELFGQAIFALKLEGLNPNEPPHATLIAHSKKPFNQNKVRDSEEMYVQFAERDSGRAYYYERTVNRIQDMNYLFMPSDRVLILSNLPQYEFEPLAEREEAEPLLSAEKVALIDNLQENAFWAILPFSDELQRILHRYSQVALKGTPELAQVLEIFSRARTLTAGGRWENDKFALTMELVCADETAAEKALTTFQTYWQKHSKSWIELPPGLPKDRQALLQDLTAQTKFSREDKVVRLTTLFSPPPAEALTKLLPIQSWTFWGVPQRDAQPVIPPERFPPGRRPPRGLGPGGPNQPPPRKV